MEGYTLVAAFFLCPITDISATVHGTGRREILHDDTHRFRTDLLPFGGGTPGSPNPKIWA